MPGESAHDNGPLAGICPPIASTPNDPAWRVTAPADGGGTSRQHAGGRFQCSQYCLTEVVRWNRWARAIRELHSRTLCCSRWRRAASPRTLAGEKRCCWSWRCRRCPGYETRSSGKVQLLWSAHVASWLTGRSGTYRWQAGWFRGLPQSGHGHGQSTALVQARRVE